MSAERRRLEEATRRDRHWRRWGPYLSERAWGTVREDYSADGSAWEYFPHDQAHLRAYRWGEDGIGGISDNHQRLCFALALWNGCDPILKERLFGLSGPEGNHGEDVKELYYYLDSTPTHSYMKCLYKYPQAAYPYEALREVNRSRSRHQPEYEILDSGVFNNDRYFDIFIEYAKAEPDDILVRITAVNRGPDSARLHLIPTLWFRNTWSWGRDPERPRLGAVAPNRVAADHSALGRFELQLESDPVLLFTDNESNSPKLWNHPGPTPFYKDAFQERIVSGNPSAVNPDHVGTKACAWYQLDLAPGGTATVRARLAPGGSPVVDIEAVFAQRIAEADEFYSFFPGGLSEDGRSVERQAIAGMLWSKQYFHYVVDQWLAGDPAYPPPPPSRQYVRNRAWVHLYNEDILSMPDKWEYPWYAAWDSAFHMIPLSLVDPDFAKGQLALFLREWYMHPNGQIPAYEWFFDDVNPPVHAWACWRVFKIDAKLQGRPDHEFLQRVFHKLLMNFTWWVNRKDSEGNNIFEGGFLGLDNIGIFDRSKPLPTGGRIEQSDGTSWMAMYCLNMLKIALELAQCVDDSYEDIASKFFEHFLFIAAAMNRLGDGGLWDEEDNFFYDRLRLPDGRSFSMKARSMVGLIPLFAVDTIEPSVIARLGGFRRRMEWFTRNRPDLCCNIASTTAEGVGERRLLALLQRDRLRHVLTRMLDETEFLSPFGVRSLSRAHRDNPYLFHWNGAEYRIEYEPAESRTGLFGGNSNWRGPIWFPVNFLLIEALQKFNHYHGAGFQMEFPTGSGRLLTLGEIACELSRRLARLFVCDERGRRPCYGDVEKFQTDPLFRDHLMFHEYFDGDTGMGLGASHQTGWTGLVAKLIQQSGI